LECLRSLAASSVAIGTIIVDNASTDDTAELLSRVDGIEVVRNETNVGFLDAANSGLMTSRTPYTLLLNNDATVTPDAIERALEALADPTVGAVAGRIVLPNGLLQEAGSFLWQDGSAQGYLRGQQASIGAAMHRREVDFGSGAFLLLRTSVAQSVDGFDPAFKPAYGEEVDLCLRMRQAGYRTVYDPRVVVDHVEFASSKDPSAALALQEQHRAVLEKRHRAELEERPLGELRLSHRVAHWATHGTPGVLIVDDQLPYPYLGSGNPRARDVLWEITEAAQGPVLLAPTHQKPFADWRPVWDEFGLDIEIYPEPGMAGLSRVLEQHAGRYRTLWVSRYHNLTAILDAEKRHPGLLTEVRVIFDAEAITTVRTAQHAALNGMPWFDEQLTKAVGVEASAALRADVVLAVNEVEAAVFRAHGAEDVRVLGHALEVRPGSASFEDRDGLVFIGRMTEVDSPNVDGLRWFFQHVWPRWAAAQRPSLTLVGQVAPALADEFTRQGAVVTGPVDDLAPCLNAARVLIAPTRYAAGVPHKVHEAAAAGVPVVATPLLVQQLGWTAGTHLLVGSEPAEFARSAWLLLDSPDLWVSVRRSALERVRADCDPRRFAQTVDRILAFGGG
jgi:GT2 family glycosyltransferase/glycosyltransferase involved in cell wall biosynthesis